MVVKAEGVPPLALIRSKGEIGPAENRITSSGPHVAPRPSVASQTTCAAPPLRSIVFSLVSAKNPTERLSGDQNGNIAPAVPASMRASNVFVGRTQSAVLPSAAVAAKTIDAPSGESTGGPAESPVRLRLVFSGGSMTARMECTGWAGWLKRIAAAAPT